MPETIKFEMTQEEAALLSSMLDQYNEKLGKIFEEMDKDQVEIEQYAAQTRAIIGRMQGGTAMANSAQITDYRIQIVHYPTQAGERWRAAVLSLPAIMAEGASREDVLSEIKSRLAEVDTTSEIVTLPVADLSTSANRNGDYSAQNGNLVEASLAERLRGRGWTDFDRFAGDPGALELFDEIERERDKHLVGGE